MTIDDFAMTARHARFDIPDRPPDKYDQAVGNGGLADGCILAPALRCDDVNLPRFGFGDRRHMKLITRRTFASVSAVLCGAAGQ